MLGPYQTKNNGTIDYKGNKIFRKISDISRFKFDKKNIEKRVTNLSSNLMWQHIAKINHSINKSAHDYFNKIGALFTFLPLTTRMISSPGGVYSKTSLDYTTDTCPITLKWFDLKRESFLSESSQIYLELALLQKNISQVYSIYNSFRKEKADPTHLSEFHHIEYEGKIYQRKNIEIIKELISTILKDLFRNNEENLSYFLHTKKLAELGDLSKGKNIHEITLENALNLLYRDTKKDKYKQFTLQNFGSWEEARITEIIGGLAIIKEHPLLEIPFYHAEIKEHQKHKVANNADFIWPGYREIVGSGHRIGSIKELEEKAKIFNLPKNDYDPYIDSRKSKNYKRSSGFGLGIERFVQGILETPFIWSAVQFPRGHTTLKP